METDRIVTRPLITMTVRPSFAGERVYRIERGMHDPHRSKYVLTTDEARLMGHCDGSAWRQRPIDTALAEKLLSEVEAMTISAWPEEVYGLDGTTTTIEITRGFNAISCSWWGDLPKQWENLRRILDFFQSV